MAYIYNDRCSDEEVINITNILLIHESVAIVELENGFIVMIDVKTSEVASFEYDSSYYASEDFNEMVCNFNSEE